MIDRKRFALNRIIKPDLSLRGFLEFAASVGVTKVELRNDIRDGHPVDNLPPGDAARMANDLGINIITINALQHFNLVSELDCATAELEALLNTARAIACPAIVLCPHNDPADNRSPDRRAAETTEALAAFGPMFTRANITGLIEPLGFAISSLASLIVAQDCIRGAGHDCFRIVHDTFHHHIGPDDAAALGSSYDVSYTGLVHVSGVEDDIPLVTYRDEHRILVGPSDRMNSKDQIIRLDTLGFRGDYSFEPFSPAVQDLTTRELAEAVRRSIDFIAT